MKELTIEEKAKAYDKALERTKGLVDFCSDNELKTLEYVFPELKDSEDDRIRKALIDFFQDWHKTKPSRWNIPVSDVIAWLEKQGEPQGKGEISDGYHTFNELYYYRMLYNAAFFNMLPKEWVHKSKKHHDGEDCFGGGWFIVMANLPTGQVSNHYELKDWDLFQIPEKEVADKWDGHTPQEAADRLHKYLLEKQDKQPSAIRWYDVSLIPQEMEELLVEWDSEDATWHEIAFYHADTKTFWNGTRQVENVTRWCYITDLLEKQGEQKPYGQRDECMDCQFSYAGECKGYCAMKRGEQNPTNRVEPKFKVGDWITNGATKPAQISSIEDDMYYTHNGTIGGDIESIDKDYHLWTIADAKDGDVLSDGTIFIFKDLLSDGSVISYCDYDTDSGEGDVFCPLSMNLMCSKITPATKEQRNLLFQKIKENGYEWDAEKKELKKIEQKPTQETKPFKVEHGKYYYCIKDCFCGGRKQASKGDVVQALRGLPIMGLKDASEYFLPVNFIKEIW